MPFFNVTMLFGRACPHSFPDRAIRRILMAYRPSQVRHTTWGRVSVPLLATEDEPRLHRLAYVTAEQPRRQESAGQRLDVGLCAATR